MKEALPKAILFDLDDTIISFSGSSEGCWREACEQYAGSEVIVFVGMERATHAPYPQKRTSSSN